ncbi:hypothetical protein KKG22_03415 [Patescibacteria group bacterium]|nr:hypothetical protein [Patescibacteria group bacterium]MBU1721198.1 hypothetical protein [Patescibacteria group bacterium]MBU1901094.1 hypothetical protein [Patescibacteria group bacterium]
MSENNITHDQISLTKTCPLCGEHYDKGNICIVEEGEEAQLYHVTCQSCHHAMLAFILSSEKGVGTIGMLTDLHLDDVNRLRHKPAIKQDDIIVFHSLLKQQQFIYSFT